MIRGVKRTTPAQMEAVAKAFARIDSFADLKPGWAKDWKTPDDYGKPSTRAAREGARKLIAGRPHLASLAIFPTIEGGVSLETGGDRPAGVTEAFGSIEIGARGGVTLFWDDDAADVPRLLGKCPDDGLEGVSVGTRDFTKALDRLTLPRPAKQNANKPTIDGIRFDSDMEGARYLALKADPSVSDLKLQVPFEFAEGGRVMFKWLADFTYLRDGVPVYEDVKGQKTPVYNLKKKLLEARHGFRISEWTESRKRDGTAREKPARSRKIRKPTRT